MTISLLGSRTYIFKVTRHDAMGGRACSLLPCQHVTFQLLTPSKR